MILNISLDSISNAAGIANAPSREYNEQTTLSQMLLALSN
jgi:hypothetical protein